MSKSKTGDYAMRNAGNAARPMTIGAQIQEMVNRIVAQFHPERIILFGSHAHGVAGRDSDVDLLVIKPVAGSRRAERLAIRTALRGIGVAKDIVLATPEEVETSRDLVGTIIRPALREGKVLYERPH
jgi:predicted nucleotidyltransferase